MTYLKKYLAPTIWLFLSTITVSLSQSENTLKLFNNGKSEYRIVVRNNASKIELLAASEFQGLFYDGTGYLLPLITDRKKSTEFEIHIGENKHTRKLISDLKSTDLEEDGYYLQTIENKLIIIGGTDKGLLYGVYSFFEKYLGYRKYSSRAKIIPKLDSIHLGSIHEKQVPEIKFRETYYQDIIDNPQFADWLKADNHKNDWGMWVHTFQRLVPPDKYFNNHPEYFAMINGKRMAGTQLCLSDTNVLEVLIHNLASIIEEKPDVRYWSVSQNDNQGFCQCSRCRTIDENERAHSGSVLHFVNQVAKRFPDKTISTLAYQYSRSAPLNVKPDSNVNIMFCSIECNRSRPIVTDDSSAAFRKDMEEWSKLTNNILVWDYVIQFENLVSPFPNLRILQPNIQCFLDQNATAMFQQGNRETGGEFAELRAYLISKLLWDPDIDIDSVMNDFLIGYYDEAHSYIRGYIDRMHDALEDSGKDLSIFGHPADHRDGYLSPKLIREYNSLFDLAEEAVINMPEYHRRVKEARLPLDYAFLEIARISGKEKEGVFMQVSGSEWIVKPEIRQKLDEFVDLCDQNGITRIKEWNMTPFDYLITYENIFNKGIEMNYAFAKPVVLTWQFNPKYTGDYPDALTDGLRGTIDWRHLWQGFEKDDLEGVIDLGEIKTLHSLEAEFLQDVRQWIFMPLEVKFYGSIDKKEWTEIGSVQNMVSLDETEVIIRSFTLEVEDSKARYVKILAKNIGLCPELGSGGKAWIFCDEIIVK